MRALSAGIATVLLALFCAASAVANPGGVEIAYGGQRSGSVDITPAMPGSPDHHEPVALAIGPRNEAVVLIAVDSGYPLEGSLFIRRYAAGGALESEFGERAGALGDVEPLLASYFGYKFYAGLAVQPDGKTVVAFGNAGGITLLRLNPDGGLDTGFGFGGRTLTPIAGPTTISSVALRADGGIVVAGAARNERGNDLLLARYSKAGRPVSSFGKGGVVLTGVGNAGIPAGIALREGNAVLGTPQCCLAQTNGLTGRTDPVSVAEFSERGHLVERFAAEPPSRLLALEPLGISTVIARRNGSTMVVGSAREGTVVSSYLPNGKLDPRFGNKGSMLILHVFAEGGAAAIRDRQGGVVLAGWSSLGEGPFRSGGFSEEEALALKRVKPNGRLDPNFGGARPNLSIEENGNRVGLDLGRALAIAPQSNGRLMVLAATPRPECVRTCSGIERFGLIRYFGEKAKRPVRCQGRTATLAGTPRDDTLTGTPGPDVIVGFAGADRLRGHGGNDVICGGRGSDTLIGGPGEDQLRGGPGRDRVHQ